MASEKEGARVLFDGIAHRYDFLNRLLSAGVDRRWRSRLVSSCPVAREARILDVATGTGDILVAFGRTSAATLVGIDISRGMLNRARNKKSLASATFFEASALAIPFRDHAFDVVTAAFGVRNFSDRSLGLHEMRRVLRPGGNVRILEFTKPRGLLLQTFFRPYFRFLLPRIGAILSGHPGAYTYLYESVMDFPSSEAFADEMRYAGFNKVDWEPLSGGIATLFKAS